MAPRIPDRCAVCGEPLGDRYWFDVDAGARHEHCVDWTKRASPITAVLRRLRRLRMRLARAVRAVDQAGGALAGLERGWPRNALAALERMRTVIAELEKKLRELSVDVKW